MEWTRSSEPGADPPDIKCKTRFLVDENVGNAVAEFLRQKGFNAAYCGDIGLLGHSDEDVLARAWRERRVLLTHDRDFLDDERFPHNRNPGVIIMPGAGGDWNALKWSIRFVVRDLGHAPSIWVGTKIVISMEEVSIRTRAIAGRFIAIRYRVRKGILEEKIELC